MSTYPKLLGIAAAVFGFGLSGALAASDVWKGSWKFEMDRWDRPWIGYYDARGKTVFRFGCGTHFEMDAVYPGGAPPKQDHTKASITIANGKTQMDFAGYVFAPSPEVVEMPTDLALFNEAELGHPELDEDKWGALENRFFDLLDSGQPLTISAEGKSYVLPPVNARRWRARWQKIC